MNTFIRLLAGIIVVIPFVLSAQTPIPFQQGTISAGSYHGGDVDDINLQNGALSLHIPLFSLPQKGKLTLSYSLVFNGNYLRSQPICTTDYTGYEPQTYCETYAQIGSQMDPGLVLDQSLGFVYVQPDSSGGSVAPVGGSNAQTFSMVVADGGRHPLLPNVGDHNTQYASDGSGYLLHLNNFQHADSTNCPAGQYRYAWNASAVTPEGIIHDWSQPDVCVSSLPVAHVSDRFGNQMTFESDGPRAQDFGWGFQATAGWVQDSVGRYIPGFPSSFLNSIDGCPNLGDSNQPALNSKTWTIPGPNGNNVTYRFCYTSITYNSNDGMKCWPTGYCFNAGPAGQATVLQSVVLPNSTFWGFLYNSDGIFNGNYATDFTALAEAHGDIKRLIYPTGGTVDYSYNSGSSCADGTTNNQRRVTSRFIGGTSAPWTYSYVLSGNAYIPSVTTVRDPEGNETVHEYQGYDIPCFIGVETSVKRYRGSSSSGDLIETETTQYANAHEIQQSYTQYYVNLQPSSSTKTLTQGSTVSTTYLYPTIATTSVPSCALWSDGVIFNGGCGNPYVVPIQFAQPNGRFTNDPNALGTVSVTEYEWQQAGSPANALSANDLLLPHAQCIYPGSAVASSCPSSGGSYSVYTYNSQGNVLSKTSRIAGSISATTSYTYTTSGRIKTTQNPNGNLTTIDYGGDELFPSKLTRPTTGSVPHVSYYHYDSNTGNLLWMVDENGNSASDAAHMTNYSYDVAGRMTDVKGPPINGLRPETEACYSDLGGSFCATTGAPYSIYKKVHANPSSDQISQIVVDGFGRISQQIDAGGYSSETTYDSLGRVHSVTNPHGITPSGTDGITTFLYDVLGRKTGQVQPDGNSISWQYIGDYNLFSDESGHSWKRVTDSFGRVIDVYEDPAGLNLHTHYEYDVLSNLKTATQNGVAGDNPRIRRFNYDSLSRLTQACNPEGIASGTSCDGQFWSTSYEYDANSNLTSKGGNRGLTTSYYYDALNRLTDVIHPDATPNKHYGYDQPHAWDASQILSNTIGRLSQAVTDRDSRNFGGSPPACGGTTSATGAYDPANNNPTRCDWTDELYSYDSMGRITQIYSAFPSEAGWAAHQVNAAYDLSGNLTNLTYPDGRVVTQGWNGAGRLQNVTFDSWNGQHVGYAYAAGFTYTPAGAQTEVNYNGGVYIHTPYNNRQQMCQVWSSGVGGQGLIDTHIYFGGSTIFCNNTPGNNGNVTEIKDWKDGDRTQYFGYDNLNRLAAFIMGGVSQIYNVDSFGNLSQSGTMISQLTYDANNHISSGGYTYDAAGNVVSINNGITTIQYGYDAEDRLFRTGNSFYTYDANGNRMRKDSDNSNTNFTEYQYFNGLPIAEKHPDGSWSDYIFANGKRIARADGYIRSILFTGTFQSPGNYGEMRITPASQVIGYTIRSHDKLIWRQKQSASYGGLYFFTTDNSLAAWTLYADDGDFVNDFMVTDGNWHTRVADLSSFADKAIREIDLVAESNSPAGAWSQEFADVVIVSEDGSVRPVYNGGSTIAGAPWGTAGYINPSLSIKTTGSIDPVMTTTYEIGNHLGSPTMGIAGNGWPISSTILYPFGYTISDSSLNHYKFTGKERDTESGLDYFGARYYGSSMGRFMSPDPGNVGANAANPQSWNMYSYSLNNPLIFTDPTGLYTCADSAKCDSANDKAFATALSAARDAANKLTGNDKTAALKAISSFGDATKDNGVKVGFSSSVNGGLTQVSGVANGNRSDLNPNGQNISVTLNPNFANDAYGGADLVTHEGSHVADGSAWVASGFSSNFDPTYHQGDIDANHVQFNIMNSINNTNFPSGWSGASLYGGSPKWNQGNTFKMITPDLENAIRKSYAAQGIDDSKPSLQKGAVLPK